MIQFAFILEEIILGKYLLTFILFLGFIFTGMTIFVFFNVSTNQESIAEKKLKAKKREEQLKRIASLYPKKMID